MSTFKGVMVEFPELRVDFFRHNPNARSPLACFLSHVHSDHLAGLESFKSPFLYCSAATKEILLRLERYPHRVNFAKGILESRKQVYKHLQNLLKPIPMETPTRIELAPGNEIQVTLFDANYCTGAVMFLFERDDKAVLYTGDIRSEPWFVNSLTRNPFLIEYTSGLKTLDCIYLDTSNLRPTVFPPKADGLKELLQKVSKYPKDTVFHFSAWTFGYEEVWMALSKALKSPIHVDRYKMRLYEALRGTTNKEQHSGPFIASEGPQLTGYKCGNTPQAGCLTNDENVRLHSCEKGMHCSAIQNKKIVWIKPIVTRTKDEGEIEELGVGGGGGDLAQHQELEVNSTIIDQLLDFFPNIENPVLMDIKEMFQAGLRSTKQAISLDDMGFERDEDALSLTKFTKVLTEIVTEKRRRSQSKGLDGKDNVQELPEIITFPYSRHSSYPELCDLVKVFKPKDIYPCTVDEDYWHKEGYNINKFFGHECSGKAFRHDAEMQDLFPEEAAHLETQQTQTTEASQPSQISWPTSPVQRVVASCGNVSEKSPRRNSQEFRNFFDTHSNKMSVDAKRLKKATPPREIAAASPGSASQSLRRKAITDGLDEQPTKRVRLHFDDPGLSPSQNVSEKSEETRQKTPAHEPEVLSHERQALNITPRLEPASMRFRVEIDAWANGEKKSQPDISTQGAPAHAPQSPTSQSPDLPPPVNTPGSENDTEDDDDALLYRDPWNDPDANLGLSDYWDPDMASADEIDGIPRCRDCGHELWIGSGPCTNEECRYYEAYRYCEEPETGGPRPVIIDKEINEYLEGHDRRVIVGYFLDDQSSAYDSQDEESEFVEEYEADGFIDDGPQEEPESEVDASSNDGEVDYEAKYTELRATHTELLNDYFELAIDFEGFRRDVLGSDYESDMDDEDEDGIHVVEVNVPDPIVTEIVVSQALGQSQSSQLSEGRIRDRVEAFEAASSGAWHEISMVSTVDNHTFEEVEL